MHLTVARIIPVRNVRYVHAPAGDRYVDMTFTCQEPLLGAAATERTWATVLITILAIQISPSSRQDQKKRRAKTTSKTANGFQSIGSPEVNQ